ncbi:prepilin-type N-terminal cleavage/methylation domain-containing protein [Jeotgalibacillus sp. R-1-5s-1]|uniref:prepilin-type N-terminal cleavage/methylation domain-containing protein n=1 Tax=Jeotgalibacillus sp. R-1-5s-1 TaxID=2555897 RepID=UPI00106C1F5B|nr:prepilin-type N-terminal cleavage/methylation domain-containing protein [Jeotgalibacillus sp. R-1-5s-1]TFD99558.1 hypothetical protein E2491_07555 [Jeotgalibacillus sp. R-1-5s-1]
MVKNQQGISLVEVMASIVIITMLLTVFLTMFLTSARSNEASEEIVDYTFIAQRQMEELYEAGQQYSSADIGTVMTNILGFTNQSAIAGESIWVTNGTASDGSAYTIELTLRSYTPESSEFSRLGQTLRRTIVEVYPQPGTQPVSKMESLIEWRD